jgi:hypothetical protein
MPGVDDDELLTAYVDGVAELTPSERTRAEAAMSTVDAKATRDILAQLRALPEAAHEPDWAAMERSIGRAVGEKVPRPWWSISWRWALPVVACGAAAIAIVMVTRPDAPTAPAPIAHRVELPKPTTEPVHEAAPMVYLDGEAMDIDKIDPSVLDDLETPDIANEDNLLPTDHWVDQLDDRALDRAERVLAKRKKS